MEILKNICERHMLENYYEQNYRQYTDVMQLIGMNYQQIKSAFMSKNQLVEWHKSWISILKQDIENPDFDDKSKKQRQGLIELREFQISLLQHLEVK